MHRATFDFSPKVTSAAIEQGIRRAHALRSEAAHVSIKALVRWFKRAIGVKSHPSGVSCPAV